MIAPRKKKIIKLIIMAWSVVLVITGSALPVLAAIPTDDSGNVDFPRFNAYWYIYNTDTQTYELTSVSVSDDGLTYVFPTNLYGVTRLRFQLYLNPSGTSTAYNIDNLGFSYSIVYNSTDLDYNNYLVECDYIVIGSYLSASSSTFSWESEASNPDSFYFDDDYQAKFFDITFRLGDTGYVSGAFTFSFDSFVINSTDIRNSIYISNLDDSTEDLDSGVEALATALPLPTFDADVYASAEAIADDYVFFNDGLRFTFMESDLVTHIFILVVYFTCLSIAIFGHAGG